MSRANPVRPGYVRAPGGEVVRVLGKIASWLETASAQADASAKKSRPFPALREAYIADAKNYRAMARAARAALAKEIA